MDHISPSDAVDDVEWLRIVGYEAKRQPVAFVGLDLPFVRFLGLFLVLFCMFSLHVSVEDEES